MLLEHCALNFVFTHNACCLNNAAGSLLNSFTGFGIRKFIFVQIVHYIPSVVNFVYFASQDGLKFLLQTWDHGIGENISGIWIWVIVF